MNLEDQVCTLQQSEILYKLGVAGESLFYHTNSKFGILPKKSIDFSNGYVPNAFTVAELGIMLPEFIRQPVPSGKKSLVLSHLVCFKRKEIEFIVTYQPATKGHGRKIIHQIGLSEATARAAMLINLLEQKLITPEEINKKL